MKNVELPFIREMFDTIAPRYDFLNRSLSLRQDVYWRRKMVSRLGIKKGAAAKILDVACGTGDVALEAVKQLGENIAVTGADFSEQMLILGKRKVEKSGMASSIQMLVGNALSLPFGDNIFDAVTIAFGIRNIKDREGALKAFHSTLKSGGTLAVLELATPENRFLRALYLFYFRGILPFIGGFFSKDPGAYHYLPESVINFPDSKTFASQIESAGFQNVAVKKMSMGTVTLYTGKKP